MRNLPLPAQDSVLAQAELFRRAKAEESLSIAVLAKRSPIPKTTLASWEAGTVMPAWALFALGEAGVPDHLLSLVSNPFGRCVVTEEDGEGDLDSAAIAANEFAGEVAKARHPKSPGGLAIVPQEKAVINPKRQSAVAAMRRAA